MFDIRKLEYEEELLLSLTTERVNISVTCYTYYSTGYGMKGVYRAVEGRNYRQTSIDTVQQLEGNNPTVCAGKGPVSYSLRKD